MTDGQATSGGVTSGSPSYLPSNPRHELLCVFPGQHEHQQRELGETVQQLASRIEPPELPQREPEPDEDHHARRRPLAHRRRDSRRPRRTPSRTRSVWPPNTATTSRSISSPASLAEVRTEIAASLKHPSPSRQPTPCQGVHVRIVIC